MFLTSDKDNCASIRYTKSSSRKNNDIKKKKKKTVDVLSKVGAKWVSVNLGMYSGVA